MPSDTAISIRNLSKAYTIAHNQEKHITLTETILARVKNPLARAKRETFWALRDVSFDIKKGGSRWDHREKRGGEEHAAEDTEPDYGADVGGD